jgi:hypothetical protein
MSRFVSDEIRVVRVEDAVGRNSCIAHGKKKKNSR